MERLRESLSFAGALHPAIDGTIIGTRGPEAEWAVILALADGDDPVARLRLADVPDQVRFYESIHDYYRPIKARELTVAVARSTTGDHGIFGWLLEIVVDRLDAAEMEDILS